jgi:hypothetical protein
LDLRYAVARHTEMFGGGVADADYAASGERSAIIDPHDDGSTVAKVVNLKPGSKRQGAMSRRQRACFIAFAARCYSAVGKPHRHAAPTGGGRSSCRD